MGPNANMRSKTDSASKAACASCAKRTELPTASRTLQSKGTQTPLHARHTDKTKCV